jgi:hypothetical protein
MKKTGKYPGIGANSNAERAIDIVIAEETIEGPVLAARMGVSTYEIGFLKRPVAMGYLKKSKVGNGNKNVYSAGASLPLAGQSAKSVTRLMLEKIASYGKLTSRALGELLAMEPSGVSGCLTPHTKNGVVKVRFIKEVISGRKRSVCEYYDANLPLYMENCGRLNKSGTTPMPIDKAGMNIVPPRTPPAFRPLNVSRIVPASMRDGAMDFRSITSLHARKACA